ncbi:MAG: methylmalonyl-CoA mutase family protein, partial [Myxococcota bacterium]|nr:methylmalonyl-CoA mutase family protein [Myxococcota bacterium]
LIQDGGAEVIHLGHNRSVHEVVKAAIEEDAQAIAISSYQGGHVEYFRFMLDLLEQQGAGHIRIFGGGGGVIVPEEIRALHDYGITRIYSPEDGRRLGLVGLIDDLLQKSDFDPQTEDPDGLKGLAEGDRRALARAITLMERDSSSLPTELTSIIESTSSRPRVPVIGITGTGGAGKSSFTDELVRRFLEDFGELKIAIISIDPTRRRTGGALLGDRIRMNSLRSERCFMRSLATRGARGELSDAAPGVVRFCSGLDFDLVLVETSGIGQGDSAITSIVDLSIYVMTPEFGAPSQLEKIDMLDFADLVVVNKFDRRGAEDALRDVRKQVRRNRNLFDVDAEQLPVFGSIASQFHDLGVNAVYRFLLERIDGLREGSTGSWLQQSQVPDPETRASPSRRRVVPPARSRYLGEVAETVHAYHTWADEQAEVARRESHLLGAAQEVNGEIRQTLQARAAEVHAELDARCASILEQWDATVSRYREPEFVYQVRGREVRQPLYFESLSKLKIPRIVPPRYADAGDRLHWALTENLPGQYPFTAGVFPLKRLGEEPKRMFAGEGGPAKTNSRFHFLCKGEPVHRLSTAFDSVTLYGEDPDERPDIYGKIGESGVSVPTLDDMKTLYAGFDLCAPTTSVSMTINGPAPILLAMFFNTAIDQQLDRFRSEHDREPTPEEAARVRANALSVVRGTVQADILKEDQAQNTCIFSTEFAMRMMGDIQQYFIEHQVRNYYSVSISGYHIAEAGANPISQLAFTLSNGFTLVEYYLSRGMGIDQFAPNLSFFFSNGMDPEYTVLGRVARRVWAVTMDRMYGASTRAQKLKYHIQTSGRSLHARDIQFNDIRTTLQALLALYDNCNSLHTNAYDEAVTTPTEESVRRAMAIQKILNQEFGLLRNENALQGSFVVEELTDLVEQAVLQEFSRLNDRGGVLGAMETMYQRGRIQEESLYYEHRKHTGDLPLVG